MKKLMIALTACFMIASCQPVRYGDFSACNDLNTASKQNKQETIFGEQEEKAASAGSETEPLLLLRILTKI